MSANGRSVKPDGYARPFPVADIDAESADAGDGVDVADAASTSSSLYQEALEDELITIQDINDDDVCSVAEGRMYREFVRTLGIPGFVERFIDSGKVTAKKLLSAFQVRPPDWLAGEPDSRYYKLLGYAITRELSRRARLPAFDSVDDAVNLLKRSQNIMVITGAGISTNLGIPDFRSEHNGLYSKLRQSGMSSPEDLFTLEIFDDNPQLFYDHAADLLPELNKWTPTHQFIRLLQDKNKLRRNYTQNIDNVESGAGIVPDKLVQCHGSWATFSCRRCGHTVPGVDLYESIRQKTIVKCDVCPARIGPAGTKKRKRNVGSSRKRRKRNSTVDSDSDSDGRYDIPTAGVMKPDITFFGEALPNRFFDIINKVDRIATDLVIVMGTSMKVTPVSEIPHYLPSNVPHIYISRDPCHHINFDITLLGDCDTIVTELCRRAGWNLKHEMVPDVSEVIVEKHDIFPGTYFLTRTDRI